VAEPPQLTDNVVRMSEMMGAVGQLIMMAMLMFMVMSVMSMFKEA